MKGFRSTFFFALLVIGFAGYVYYFEYVKKEEAKTQKEESKRLAAFVKEDVQEVKFLLDGKPLTLLKQKGSWQITEPLNDLADTGTLDVLVDTLTTSKGELVVEGEEVNLQEFGLDKPKGEVIVKTAAATAHYLVGTVTSYDNEFYLQPKGEKRVLLAESRFAELLDKPIKDLRNKKIFRETLKADQNMKLLPAKGKAFGLRSVDGTWALEKQKGQANLDQKVIRSFLKDIQGLVTDNFHAENHKELQKFGLTKPHYEIQWGDVSLQLSDEVGGKYYAITSQRSQVFELAGWRAKKLFKTADEFKDQKAPFGFDDQQVRSMRLATKGINLELKKEGEHWLLAQPVAGKELNSSQVQSLLNRLSELKAERFLGAKSGPGLQPAKNQVTLANARGDSLLDLVWGQSFTDSKSSQANLPQAGSSPDSDGEKSYYYVKTDRTPETLGVLVSSIDALPVSSLLKDKEVKGDKAEEKGPPP